MDLYQEEVLVRAEGGLTLSRLELTRFNRQPDIAVMQVGCNDLSMTAVSVSSSVTYRVSVHHILFDDRLLSFVRFDTRIYV